MFPILNINFTVKYSQGSVRSLCHSFPNDVLLVPSSPSSTVLRRGSRISWNFCTVVSVWSRHLSHQILIPYPFPRLFRVSQCFLPLNVAVEVCCQLFSCLIYDVMFLFNAQLTVYIFLQGSMVSQENILDVTLTGCFIWLRGVDFLHEDLSLVSGMS